MKTVTDVRGLSNLGTATSKHIRTTPRHGGTAHLEMYLLSKERQRLNQELAQLEQRRDRIYRRLDEIREEITRLQQMAQQEDNAEGASTGGSLGNSSMPGQSSPRQTQPRWRTMPVEY